MAAYVFTGMFCIHADNETEARDGLMELLAETVARENQDAFVLEEIMRDDCPHRFKHNEEMILVCMDCGMEGIA